MKCKYCINCGKCDNTSVGYSPSNQSSNLYKSASKYNQIESYSLSHSYSSKPIKFGGGEYKS